VRIPVIAILLAFATVDATAQPATAPDAVRAEQLLAALEKRVPEAEKQIRWLRGTLRSDTALPPEVLASLASLEEALAAGGDDPEIRRLVVDDLLVKGEYCRRHPDGMGALVELRVRTWAAEGFPGSEVSQMNVLYLSAPLAERRTSGEPFPSFSSPTVKRLPPGRYVIWAEHPSDPKRRGPRKTVTVGDQQSVIGAAVSADLIVPDSWR
jgi:hypothetical protein